MEQMNLGKPGDFFHEPCLMIKAEKQNAAPSRHGAIWALRMARTLIRPPGSKNKQSRCTCETEPAPAPEYLPCSGEVSAKVPSWHRVLSPLRLSGSRQRRGCERARAGTGLPVRGGGAPEEAG